MSSGIDDFLDQVEIGANNPSLFYLALSGALAIPDICGALESSDGTTDGDTYSEWFDTHIAPIHSRQNQPPKLSGRDCYRFRCSFLHQGTTLHPQSRYTRILFVEPGTTTNVFHMNVINDALNIDVRLFCLEVVTGARRWVEQVTGTEPYETNLNACVRRYAGGLPPYIVGIPVIS